jgi:RimJ/RimL family protein N-acetyltransferase
MPDPLTSWSVTDGIVTLRPPESGDANRLIAGRDEEFHRWMGSGAVDPSPTACIHANGHLVGWVDFDHGERAWLGVEEVNVGYHVFTTHVGRGFATRGVHLLLHRLAIAEPHHTATLLIDTTNTRSLAVAKRCRFVRRGTIEGSILFAREIPPTTYSDGVVTIRSQVVDDLERDLEAKDEEQQRWLWTAAQRAAWNDMSPAARRIHASKHLRAMSEGFGCGPKWTFAVDAGSERCVGYVDCDLANEHAERGVANIAYSTHPRFRRRGLATRAVRLVVRFLADHTATTRAQLLIDPANEASLAVARSLGSIPAGRDRRFARYELVVPRS